MADSDAERQRRYRLHKAGNHSECNPERGCDVTSRSFGVMGQRLWREMDGDRAAGTRWALIVEACRIADRLDKLERLLSGDARDWLDVVEDKGDPERQIVVIDRPLAEARAQAVALKQLVSELRQGVGQDAGRSAGPTASGATEGGAAVGGLGVADLSARIAARRAEATG